jgi:threonine synthase
MTADSIKIARDESGTNWIVRIQVGEEVIRRQLKLSGDASEEELRAAAAWIATDEGYTADPSTIVFS